MYRSSQNSGEYFLSDVILTHKNLSLCAYADDFNIIIRSNGKKPQIHLNYLVSDILNLNLKCRKNLLSGKSVPKLMFKFPICGQIPSSGDTDSK